MSQFTVTIHGCRGSVPVSGPQFSRYGGATTCFEIVLSPTERLLIDAGTGALRIPPLLPAGKPVDFWVLMTHVHWDHALALPFFTPLYDWANQFTFFGRDVGGMDIEEAIDRVMRPPWFPVNFRSTPARKHFREVPHEPFRIGDLKIIARTLHHPDGVVAYRLEKDGASLVVATDVEHGQEHSDEALVELARGADVLIHDAQYLPNEYLESKEGWGHSTWPAAARIAQRAGVGRLILTSHDPSRDDEGIDRIQKLAEEVFGSTQAAYEGMKIEIG